MNIVRGLGMAVTLVWSSVACSDPPTEPDAASGVFLSNGLQLGTAGILASGGGTLDITSPPLAVGEASFSFTVEQTAEGGARGRFHMIRPRAGFIVDIEGEVTCVSQNAALHRVWIGGKV